MDLDIIVFGETSLRQVFYLAGAVVGAFVCLRIVKRLFFKKRLVLQHTIYFVCSNCDWEGQVSKFGTRCPKCNYPIARNGGAHSSR